MRATSDLLRFPNRFSNNRFARLPKFRQRVQRLAERQRARRLWFESLEDRRVMATYTVTTTLDGPSIPTIPNPLVPDELQVTTLRGAMTAANSHPGPDLIKFNIPPTDPGYTTGTSGDHWWTIRLIPGLALPALIDSGTTIDGFSQTANQGDTNPGTVGSGIKPGVADSGNAAQPLTFQKPEIAIDANKAVEAMYGADPETTGAINIDGAASNICIKGMAIYNGFSAIVGQDGPGTNRVLDHMFIGVLPDGTDPGDGQRNDSFGAEQMSPGFLTTTWNYVGYNGEVGINGFASAATVTVTQNEVFGSGWATNSHDGIDINGINSTVRYNFSHDNTTLDSIPNGGGGNGIEVGSKSANDPGVIDNNVIEYNTVSNNVSAGISIRKGPTGDFIRKNEIHDNEVGISVNYEGRLPTDRDQLSQNSIYRNMGLGIDLQVAQNFIPPDAFDPINNVISGDPSDEPEPWFGYANGGLPSPIVGPDGVTPNDHCDGDIGSNDVQNYPLLTSVTRTGLPTHGHSDGGSDGGSDGESDSQGGSDGAGDGDVPLTNVGSTNIQGTLDSEPNTTYVIDFYDTPEADLFGIDDREGRTYIGSQTVTTGAEPSCSTAFSATFNVGVGDHRMVTSTATKFTSAGVPWSTSEFSAMKEVNNIDLSQKVTGGGWYNSPSGSYPQNPNLTGKANFGFNAKYKDSDPTPTGHTNFVYEPAKLHFDSTSYAAFSLVVTGGDHEPQQARWRGLGTLNGKPGYGFEINVTDNGEPGSNDTFRIHIWKEVDGDPYTEEGTIYDNGSDVSETTIGGGNIQVHMQSNAENAAEMPAVSGSASLTQSQLDGAVQQAVMNWAHSGLPADQLSALSNPKVQIANLDGALVGLAAGNVIGIDPSAAGYQWFTDESPGAIPGPGQMDLLTVVTHELGHLLGYGDTSTPGIMAGTLQPGVRVLPEPIVFFATLATPNPLSSTVSVAGTTTSSMSGMAFLLSGTISPFLGSESLALDTTTFSSNQVRILPQASKWDNIDRLFDEPIDWRLLWRQKWQSPVLSVDPDEDSQRDAGRLIPTISRDKDLDEMAPSWLAISEVKFEPHPPGEGAPSMDQALLWKLAVDSQVVSARKSEGEEAVTDPSQQNEILPDSGIRNMSPEMSSENVDAALAELAAGGG